MHIRRIIGILMLLALVTTGAMAQPADPWKLLFPDNLLDRDCNPVSTDILRGKIVGIYCSAGWCKVCQVFSPKLIPFRDKNASEFEVVFVSFDASEDDQYAYMKKYGMLWPTLKYNSQAAFDIQQRFGVEILPTLIVLNADGQMLTKFGVADVSSTPEGALAKWKSLSPQPLPPLEQPASPTVALQAGKNSRLSLWDQQLVCEAKSGARNQLMAGSIKGTIGSRNYDITLDRTASAITGTIGNQNLDIKIDREAKTIAGKGPDGQISIAFDWTREKVDFNGENTGSPFRLTLDWANGQALGAIAGTDIRFSIDLDHGVMTGIGNKINLKYDPYSGRLAGDLLGKPVKLQLTHLDLSDFIQMLYLFTR
ncbi:MAG: hypothetical protein HQM09_18385 [Candidatus Riflebacteria bacterium]|nr:hypothetical protein [Candidatus Riflebacteria bacterium]